MKPAAIRATSVSTWFREIGPETAFITSISVAEILAGIGILPEGRRRSELSSVAERIFGAVFADRILPFDTRAARAFAEAAVNRRRRGRPPDILDLQIAGIALARGMSIATRNTRDFEDTGVILVDPWSA